MQGVARPGGFELPTIGSEGYHTNAREWHSWHPQHLPSSLVAIISLVLLSRLLSEAKDTCTDKDRWPKLTCVPIGRGEGQARP